MDAIELVILTVVDEVFEWPPPPSGTAVLLQNGSWAWDVALA